MIKSLKEREEDEKRESKRKSLLSIGAGLIAFLAIGGAGFAVWSNQGVSRAERVAAKGGPEAGQQAGGQRGGGQAGRGGRGNPEQRMAQMTADLGLTPDQQTQVKALNESMRPQMQAMWQNKSLSREDKRTQMQAIRTQMQTKMRALLTPDQQAKFDAMQAQRQARRQELGQRREQTRANLIASGQTPPERGQRGGGRTR